MSLGFVLISNERIESTGLPGIFRVSLAHSPKSMSLQRSEQKGLNGLAECQVFRLLHVGQLIV